MFNNYSYSFVGTSYNLEAIPSVVGVGRYFEIITVDDNNKV